MISIIIITIIITIIIIIKVYGQKVPVTRHRSITENENS